MGILLVPTFGTNTTWQLSQKTPQEYKFTRFATDLGGVKSVPANNETGPDARIVAIANDILLDVCKIRVSGSEILTKWN